MGRPASCAGRVLAPVRCKGHETRRFQGPVGPATGGEGQTCVLGPAGRSGAYRLHWRRRSQSRTELADSIEYTATVTFLKGGVEVAQYSASELAVEVEETIDVYGLSRSEVRMLTRLCGTTAPTVTIPAVPIAGRAGASKDGFAGPVGRPRQSVMSADPRKQRQRPLRQSRARCVIPA